MNRLKEIARSLDRQIDPAIRKAAEEVALGAQVRAPFETGALKRSIHVERQGDCDYLVVAGNREVYYGHFVEFGTARGGRPGGKGERGPTPPRPFLIPAAEVVRQNIDRLVRDALKDL